jgi:prevent-host-death family protein
MMAMETVTLEEGRRTLGDLIDRARLAGEPTMITRYGKPGAVVVSADWYREAAGCLEQHGSHTAHGEVAGP